MILGFLIAFPFVILACIVGFIDPIDWTAIIGYIATGTDLSYEFVGMLAQHPYWIVAMMLLAAISFFAFILASSYALLLQAHLVLKYIDRKKLTFKKNIYFSRNHITTMI